MEKIKVSFGDPFVQYVFLKCPECAKITKLRYSSKASRDENDMKHNNYVGKCQHCDFNGVIAGSEVVHMVEFDTTEFRRAAGTA
jgi:hypothetical protein